MKRIRIQLHSGNIDSRSCMAFVLLVSLAIVVGLPYVAHAASVPLSADQAADPGNGNPPSDPGNGNGNPPSDPGEEVPTTEDPTTEVPSDPPVSSSDLPTPESEISPASQDDVGHEGPARGLGIRSLNAGPMAGRSFAEQITEGVVAPGVVAGQVAAELNQLLTGEHPVPLDLSLPVLTSAAVTTSKDYALPLLLASLVILYLLIQWRIDRRDPKMAFVRLKREEEVVFE